MFPPQSHNNSNSKNQKNDDVNPRILLKDGLRTLGVNPTRRKKVSQLAIVMDENQRSEILSQAMKLQEEKNGSGLSSMVMERSSNGGNRDSINMDEHQRSAVLEEALRLQMQKDGSKIANLEKEQDSIEEDG